MKDFIDKTSTVDGTPINRAALMAIQGFQANSTEINSSGNVITETNGEGHTLTTAIYSDRIVEVFVGEKTITKTTTFNGDGSITEVIS
jgi:hypothetical protein